MHAQLRLRWPLQDGCGMIERINQWLRAQRRVGLGRFWWIVHNMVAHFWIGCTNSPHAWRFHDWTADRMTVPERPVPPVDTATTEIVPEMIREMSAHLPFAITDRREQWEWMANYLNQALKEPDKPCECCGVTPRGDITWR